MGRSKLEVDQSTYAGQLAARLTEVRESKGKTVQDVADYLEVSVKTIYGWETGSREPSLENLYQLAKYLRCTVRHLMPPMPEDSR